MGIFTKIKELTRKKPEKEEPKMKEVKPKPKPVSKPKVQKKKVTKPKPKPKAQVKTVLKKKVKVAKKEKKKVAKVTKKAKKKVVKEKKKVAKATKKVVAKKPKKTKPVMEPKKISKNNAMKLIERDDASKFVYGVAGNEGLTVLTYLLKIGKEIDEFTLADRVKLQINFVRSLLYKLYEHKLVSFSRERDKKKGWFIYSWISHPERLREILIRQKDEKIAKLKLKAIDAQQIFYCASCDKNYSYVDAMEHMFFCSICGTQLDALDASKIREKMNVQISKILKEKKELDEL